MSKLFIASNNAHKIDEIRDILKRNGVEIEVLNGRFGPYIAKDGVNYKIAKGTDAKALTLDDCRKIIAEQADKAPAKKAKATKTTKASTKTAAKTKASTKKSAEK